MSLLDDRQTAHAKMEIGKALRLSAKTDVTVAGLLAVTVLVSGILLSTSVLVATAVREGRRARADKRLADPAPPAA